MRPWQYGYVRQIQIDRRAVWRFSHSLCLSYGYMTCAGECSLEGVSPDAQIQNFDACCDPRRGPADLPICAVSARNSQRPHWTVPSPHNPYASTPIYWTRVGHGERSIYEVIVLIMLL